MKLLFIILGDEDGDKALQALVENGFRVTCMASTGGFLRRGNITLMSGVAEDQVQAVIDLLRRTCKPANQEQHSATIFVVDMSLFEQI
jgi:uncharacterized protein YaaQ